MEEGLQRVTHDALRTVYGISWLMLDHAHLKLSSARCICHSKACLNVCAPIACCISLDKLVSERKMSKIVQFKLYIFSTCP